MSAPAFAAFERAPERRFRRSEPCPQIEDVRQLEPSFLSRADVDGLRGVPQMSKFPQAVPHPGLITNDTAVFPHQIAEGTLEGTCQLATGLDQTLQLVGCLLDCRLGATLDFGYLRVRGRGDARPPAKDDGLGQRVAPQAVGAV